MSHVAVFVAIRDMLFYAGKNYLDRFKEVMKLCAGARDMAIYHSRKLYFSMEALDSINYLYSIN